MLSCTDLYRVVQTCTALYRIVQNYTNLYIIVQIHLFVYTEMLMVVWSFYRAVQSCTVLQGCRDLNIVVQTLKALYRL